MSRPSSPLASARWLRRELLLALLLKLAALVALKLYLLPPKLPAPVAAHVVAQRIGGTSPTPASAPRTDATHKATP